MIVDPAWTFDEALDAAWAAYGGGRQFGAPNRIKMLEQWANVVGRDRAVAELDDALSKYPNIAAAVDATGLSAYALRRIKRSFRQMPTLAADAKNATTIDEFVRSLPHLANDSELGFLTRTVPRLAALLGYSDAEQFYEPSLPGVGRGVRADAVLAPSGPQRPHIIIEVRRALLDQATLHVVVDRLRSLVANSGAHAGLVLSPTALVGLSAGQTVYVASTDTARHSLKSLVALLQRPDHVLRLPETDRPSASPGDRLSSLLDEVVAAGSNEEKKRSLEGLAAEVFSAHASIHCKYRNLRTRSSELDIVCGLLPGTDIAFLRELGRFFIVECKNWQKPAGAKEIRDFLGKLRKCRVHVGVYFSRRGITGQEHGTDALREIHAAFDQDGTYILVVTGQDLQGLDSPSAMMELLEARTDALRFDI